MQVARPLALSEVYQAPFCDNKVVNSKYTLANFVPKSLFEQFRRLANVYFLGMGGLMLVGTYTDIFETPLTAFTTLFPLGIVLGVSMLQEAAADVKRHRSDDETNNRPAKLTSYHQAGGPQTSETVRWCDIKVADVLYVHNKQPLPADMVILATSEDENICYIETSSIDGETNLKLRRAINYVPAEAGPLARPEDILGHLERDQGTVHCELPNMKIESFTGTFCIPHRRQEQESGDGEAYDKVIPIDNENVLLRGAMLRNTKWAVGVVVYTGKDTKLQRNSRQAPSKMSKLDVLVNRAIYLIFLVDLILVTISALLLLQFEDASFSGLTYLGYQVPGLTPPWAVAARPEGMQWETARSSFLQGFLTFLVLFNNFVPISMYVTCEMCTYAHLYFVNNDREMYHVESDTPAKARSNTVTDLGQIQYVFSDKTGTLTQNVMRFKRASIKGIVYGAPVLMTEANSTLPYVNIGGLNEDAQPGTKADEFLKVLALCHTVVLEGDAAAGASGGTTGSGGVVYQAESPDEKALVEFAADAGYVLAGRNTQQITLRINGTSAAWTTLAVNKFDSDRKRMSIVVRDAQGRIRLLCKGADTSMLSRGACDSAEENATVVDHLKIFAQEGLRTLVLGFRELTQAEFAAWQAAYREASAAAKDRAELMSKVADDLEKNLVIVGVTAIEDKLQDGVPGCIADLAVAGVKLCVLTGDKLETAINIGYSCKVLREGMLLLQLTSGAAADIEAGLARLWKAVIDKKGMTAEFYQAKEGRPSLAMSAKRRRRAEDVGLAWDLMHKFYPNLPTTAAAAALQRHNSLSASAPAAAAPASVPVPLPPASRPIHVRFTEAAASMVPGASKAQSQPKPPLPRRRSRAHSSVTDFGFVMEGPALVYVFSNRALQTILFEVMKASTAVIACRVSPKQKAQLVKLVKEEVVPTPVTLAIGDGANDVPMLLEADVGIGVSGNEGQQAVNASDFSIAQFRFLKRLLLVHGRWDYRRISKVVLWSFYKNIALVMCLFFFLFYCGFSGTSIFEDGVLSAYNFFLGLPILTLGIFDQDVPAAFVMEHPKMYLSGRKNLDLNAAQVGKWIVSALLDGFLVFYFTIWSAPTVAGANSQDDYYALGLAMYGVLILAMNWRLLFELKTIVRPALLPKPTTPHATKGRAQPRLNCSLCGWSLWIWVGSVLSFFVGTLVYGNLSSFAPGFYGVPMHTFGLAGVWLQFLLIPVICVAIVALFTFLADEYAPSPVQLGIETARLKKQPTAAAAQGFQAQPQVLSTVPPTPAVAAVTDSLADVLEQGQSKGIERQLSAPAN